MNRYCFVLLTALVIWLAFKSNDKERLTTSSMVVSCVHTSISSGCGSFWSSSNTYRDKAVLNTSATI